MNTASNPSPAQQSRTCATCQLWEERELGSEGFNQGLGQCLNVPPYHDATEERAIKPEPECFMDGLDRGPIKPEYRRFKAYALDGSGYKAELLVAADFGCIAYVAATDEVEPE